MRSCDGDGIMDDSAAVEFHAEAYSWLHGFSVAPAVLDTWAIRIPEFVQDSLLQYYTDDVAQVGHGRWEHGSRLCDAAGAATGELSEDNLANDDKDHGSRSEDNDMPERLAAQLDVLRENGDRAQPGRIRRFTSGFLLHQLMENQIMSSINVWSLASLEVSSLYDTHVMPVYKGAAVAAVKKFEVVIAWAAKKLRGLAIILHLEW